MIFRYLITFIILLIFSFLNPCVAAEVGQITPEFVAQDIYGKMVDLKSLRGKVVILHFWATWCSVCKKEMPVLDAFYVNHHAQGVEVLGISLDKSRAKNQVTEYMKSFHFSSVLASDAEKNGFETPDQLPFTYVIDKQGIIQATLTPDKTPLSQQSLEQVFSHLPNF